MDFNVSRFMCYRTMLGQIMEMAKIMEMARSWRWPIMEVGHHRPCNHCAGYVRWHSLLLTPAPHALTFVDCLPTEGAGGWVARRSMPRQLLSSRYGLR